MYNYYYAMENDIKNYIEENINLEDYTREDLEEELNDQLWICDGVTGNASGSYTFNRYKAKEYVTENIDLCREALTEFCCDMLTVVDNFLNGDWEYFDVSIRCYLLGSIINTVLDEFEENGAFNTED